jgi:hypothetical protein
MIRLDGNAQLGVTSQLITNNTLVITDKLSVEDPFSSILVGQKPVSDNVAFETFVGASISVESDALQKFQKFPKELVEFVCDNDGTLLDRSQMIGRLRQEGCGDEFRKNLSINALHNTVSMRDSNEACSPAQKLEFCRLLVDHFELRSATVRLRSDKDLMLLSAIPTAPKSLYIDIFNSSLIENDLRFGERVSEELKDLSQLSTFAIMLAKNVSSEKRFEASSILRKLSEAKKLSVLILQDADISGASELAEFDKLQTFKCVGGAGKPEDLSPFKAAHEIDLSNMKLGENRAILSLKAPGERTALANKLSEILCVERELKLEVQLPPLVRGTTVELIDLLKRQLSKLSKVEVDLVDKGGSRDNHNSWEIRDRLSRALPSVGTLKL